MGTPDVPGRGGIIQAVQIQPLDLTIIRSVSKTRSILNVPNANNLHPGSWLPGSSDVFEADRAGVP